jgi:hypothetical protein
MPHIKLSALNQNLDLYYEIHGTGKIKILFIMGLLADGSAWYRQVKYKIINFILFYLSFRLNSFLNILIIKYIIKKNELIISNFLLL